MGRTRNSTGGAEPCKKSFVAVVEGRRQKGRPKLRWEDGVMEDVRKLGRETGGMCKELGQLAEASKEGLDSKRALVPMMMMMIYIYIY